jgi:hypothetical protein
MKNMYNLLSVLHCYQNYELGKWGEGAGYRI